MADSALQDILTPDMLDDDRVVMEAQQYSAIVQAARQIPPHLRTPFPAKNLQEFFQLVKNVVDDWERRMNVAPDAKVNFTEEQPDYLKDQGPTITFGMHLREPGAAGRGSPMRRNVIRNFIPMLREEVDDPDNPGYKKAVLGYWHDNEVKFTIWAKTNKVANEKALWFEGLMQEYSWYFTSQGVARFFFLKRTADHVSEADGQKLYSRPLHFFLRTETLTTISQKTFELINVGVTLQNR